MLEYEYDVGCRCRHEGTALQHKTDFDTMIFTEDEISALWNIAFLEVRYKKNV